MTQTTIILTAPPTLSTDSLATLSRDGYVVIPDVINLERCEYYKSSFWSWLENIGTDIKRDDPSSWVKPGAWPKTSHGIVEYPPISHAQFVHDARVEPLIVQWFSQLWKVDPSQLLVSFDRANIMRPSKGVKSRSRSWWHRDQSYSRPDLETVQAILNLEETTNVDGRLQVLRGSHLLQNEFVAAFPEVLGQKNDYLKYSEPQLAWLKARCSVVDVVAPAGSLICWDSRTSHHNMSPSSSQVLERWRYGIYLCYTPRSLATPKVLLKKQLAFQKLRETSHNPHRFRLFGKPQTWGGPKLETLYTDSNPSPPTLTALGMQLAGF